jgi:hypothetical protein
MSYQIRIATVVHNLGTGKWDGFWGSDFLRLITLITQPPAFREKHDLKLLFVPYTCSFIYAVFGTLLMNVHHHCSFTS